MANHPDHKRIQLEDLEKTWNFKASPRFKSQFEQLDLSYTELSETQRDEAILSFIDTLQGDLVKAGPHRMLDWERGWRENHNSFLKSSDISDILPKYFGKILLVRWQRNWISPCDERMEQNMLGLILEYLIEKYLSTEDQVYELGCGTGHNLLRIRKHHKNMTLFGLDWAESSQNLIEIIANQTNDQNLKAENFDYFNPNLGLKLPENSVVLTVASLEQTGSDFKEFIDYLVTEKPRIVIHVEPMWEPLDSTHLLDSLSIKYFQKRNYLNGLLKYVEELESQNLVKIINVQRTFVGSFFIEGYSILVWSPLH